MTEISSPTTQRVPKLWPLIAISVVSLIVLVLPLYFFWLQPMLYGRERITRLAIERNDPSLCQKVSMMSDTCDGWPCARIDQCLLDVAAATKNKAACDLLGQTPFWSDQQSKCYTSIAETTTELTVNCQNIPDLHARGDCVGQAAAKTEEASNCDTLSDGYAKAECYLAYIRTVAAPDASICEHVPPVVNAQGKQYAIESCYEEIALKTLDSSVCDKLERLSTVKWCKEEVAKRGGGTTSNAALSKSSVSIQSEPATNLERSFASSYLTLSFKLPQGFEIKEDKNHVAVAQSPYYTRDIGDDNAFMRLTRYDQYHTRGSQLALYRKLLKNIQETQTIVDGSSFLTLKGDDWGRFEGDSAGKVVVVMFEASWLEIIERPANKDQNFDPVGLGEQILSNFRFSKDQ